MHLSHVAQMVREGFLGHFGIALIQVSGVTADGALIPSSSVGDNTAWIDLAGQVILDVNSLDRATATGPGRHTAHLLGQALSWHVRYLKEGTMRSG